MQPGSREQTIADYLAVVRRYKWVILVAVLVVPAVAYAMSARDAEDLPGDRRRAPQPSGPRNDDHRDSDAEHGHGSVPVRTDSGAARRVAGGSRPRRQEAPISSRPDGLGLRCIAPIPDTDILTFGVELRRAGRRGAPRDRVRRRRSPRTSSRPTPPSLTRARREIRGRLEELRRAGATETDTYQELLGQEQDLRTLEALPRPGRPSSARRQCRADRTARRSATPSSAPCSGSCSESARHSRCTPSTGGSATRTRWSTSSRSRCSRSCLLRGETTRRRFSSGRPTSRRKRSRDSAQASTSPTPASAPRR